MDVKFIAADSMGVRAYCFRIKDIIVDPGAALGPKRYGLPPHRTELLALEVARERIREEVRNAKAVVITHYHYDHYMPDDDVYEGKKVFCKDWVNNINMSQRKRAAAFKYKGIPADGKEFDVNGVHVSFSPPLPHGPPGTRLGYVAGVCIDGVAYTSDSQGPVAEETVRWVVDVDPSVLILDGPPTYLVHTRWKEEDVRKSVKNVERIVGATGIRTLVVDHHTLRDERWEETFGIREVCKEAGVKLLTAAEWNGGENLPLEAWRRKLWKGDMHVSEEQIVRSFIK